MIGFGGICRGIVCEGACRGGPYRGTTSEEPVEASDEKPAHDDEPAQDDEPQEVSAPTLPIAKVDVVFIPPVAVAIGE